MYSLSSILRSKVLVASVALATFLCGSATAVASSKSIRSAPLHKVDSNKPASRLEIITAVKRKFNGRIISVRKRYKASGNDCHHVKFIDRDGELFLIHVGCKKKF